MKHCIGAMCGFDTNEDGEYDYEVGKAKSKFVPPFGPIRPGRSTKRFYFVSAPAPKNGCGEFLLLDTTTAYAKKVGYQEGSCASRGYDIPAGSATGNFALPKPLGFIGRSVTVQFFT